MNQQIRNTNLPTTPVNGDGGSYTLLDKKIRIITMLSDLFSCDKDFATEVYESWVGMLPVYVRMKNGTNSSVLVMEQTGSNSTIFNSKY